MTGVHLKKGYMQTKNKLLLGLFAFLFLEMSLLIGACNGDGNSTDTSSDNDPENGEM